MERKIELLTVSPLRAANITAAVLFVTYAVCALLFVPFMFIFILIGLSQGGGEPAVAILLPLIMVLFYPIAGAVFGWILGGLAALVYNWVRKLTGGFVFEIRDVPPEPAGSRVEAGHATAAPTAAGGGAPPTGVTSNRPSSGQEP